MKKAVSLILAITLCASAIMPAMAQKRVASSIKKAEGLQEKSPAQPQDRVLSEPKATKFGQAGAYTDGGGVWLRWQMDVEVGNIGFYIYRFGKGGSELVSESIVQGAANRGRGVPMYGETYSFFDREGAEGSAYYVEALSLRGTRTRTELLQTMTVGNMKAFAGSTSTELAAQAAVQSNVLESEKLTMTKELVSEIEDNLVEPDLPTHLSVISTPGAARIDVKKEGFYRVPKARLAAVGFDVNSDPTLWQLYVDGHEQAIVVAANGDYIEFLGRGIDTPESDTKRYYLIKGTTAGKRIESRVAHGNTSTVTSPSYLQTWIRKDRKFYVDDITNGPLENYFGDGVNTNVRSFPFTITGVDFAQPNSSVYIRLQGYSEGNHAVEVTINDQLLGVASHPNPGEVPIEAEFAIPTSHLLEGANVLKLKGTGPADFVYFDTLMISYARKFVAQQNVLSFYTQNYRAARIDGFSSANVRVFDVTRDGDAVEMSNLTFTQNGPTFGTRMPPARGQKLYAVESSAVLEPAADAITVNNPELIGATTNRADMIIISYKNFLAEAEAWADYRRGQGHAVKVIEVSEIFDEYGYGSLSSSAIKNFLHAAYQTWTAPAPQYVLLIGDASFDSRNYENRGFFNYVPSKEVSTVQSDTASDDAMADFNNDGLAEIAIGRIAARDATTVTSALAKTQYFETMVTDQMGRGFLFAYDFNNGYNFSGLSAALVNQLPMGTQTTLVGRPSPTGAADLVTAMNDAQFFVNYAGHGSTGSWNAGFFTVDTIDTLENDPDNPAVFTMLTCLNGYFHNLYNESLSEKLVRVPNKGAIAAWASSGLTTADVQAVMALRFYKKVGDGDIPRLGDLVRDAKAAILFGPDVRLSWVLLGDPMLKVR